MAGNPIRIKICGDELALWRGDSEVGRIPLSILHERMTRSEALFSRKTVLKFVTDTGRLRIKATPEATSRVLHDLVLAWCSTARLIRCRRMDFFVRKEIGVELSTTTITLVEGEQRTGLTPEQLAAVAIVRNAINIPSVGSFLLPKNAQSRFWITVYAAVAPVIAGQLAVSLAGPVPDENAPLVVTVSTANGEARFGERTLALTLAAMRAGVLCGSIEASAATEVQQRSGEHKKQWRGTFREFALSRPELAGLYAPIRHHALLGLQWGAVIGVCLWLLGHYAELAEVNKEFALLYLLMAFCLTVIISPLRSSAPPLLLALASVGVPMITGFMGFRGGLGPVVAVFGACITGGALLSVLGMALGSGIGVLKRGKLPRAFDAVPESAARWVGIPFGVSIVLWGVYVALMRTLT